MFFLYNELLLTQFLLIYCDFTAFAGWIDKEYKIIKEKKLFYTDKNTDGMWNTNRIIDRHNPSESSRELKKL
jgi:hypothetical protein